MWVVVCCVFVCVALVNASGFSTCRDAHNGGNYVDDYYTLSLKVDAALVANWQKDEDGNQVGAKGCGISDDQGVFPFNLVHHFDTGYVHGYDPRCLMPIEETQIEEIRYDRRVYCHMMGINAGGTPRAYIDVNPTENIGQLRHGDNLFTTQFSKLRFHETKQLIYTADCEFVCLSCTYCKPVSNCVFSFSFIGTHRRHIRNNHN